MLQPSDLVEIRKIMVATHLVTSGQLDKELTLITEATQKLDEKHKSIMLVAEAEAVRRDADRALYDAKVKIAADEEAFAKRVAAHDRAVSEHKDAVSVWEKRREEEQTAAVKAQRQRKAEAEASAALSAQLASEQARIAAITDSLNERNLVLTQREQQLNERIAKMKELAA